VEISEASVLQRYCTVKWTCAELWWSRASIRIDMPQAGQEEPELNDLYY
jgi:hypothetical protein